MEEKEFIPTGVVTELQGREVFYSEFRIPRDNTKGIHHYECRGDDEGDFVTPWIVRKSIMVNFVGTILCEHAITLDKWHELSLTSEEASTLLKDAEQISYKDYIDTKVITIEVIEEEDV